MLFDELTEYLGVHGCISSEDAYDLGIADDNQECTNKVWDRHSADTTEAREQSVAAFMEYWRTHG